MTGKHVYQFAEDTSSDEFIIQESMQKHLEQVCSNLELPHPNYTLHEVKVINGMEFHRYCASVGTGAMGTPTVSIGRFAKNEYDGKEAAAASLLKKLLGPLGRQIRDINFYNMDSLEIDFKKALDENVELKMQLEILKKEMDLRSK
ncbi:hypothetical protein E2542_SST01923 [Spatholobus suberectus]|nr:hypothetical protein E2542_SST01923 [Spatholobus suberectus]